MWENDILQVRSKIIIKQIGVTEININAIKKTLINIIFLINETH